MKFIKKYIDYLPLLVLGITFIYCLVTIFTKDYFLFTSTWLGYAFSLVCLIISFNNKKYYIWALGVMFFLGLFSIITFTPTIRTYSFWIGPFGLTIEPYSFFMLVLYFLIFNKSIFENKVSNQEVQNSSKDKVIKENKILLKFEMKTDNELQKILDDKDKLQEAREAAEQILQKRKSRGFS